MLTLGVLLVSIVGIVIAVDIYVHTCRSNSVILVIAVVADIVIVMSAEARARA